MDQEDRLAEVAALRRDVNEGDLDAIGREMLKHDLCLDAFRPA